MATTVQDEAQVAVSHGQPGAAVIDGNRMFAFLNRVMNDMSAAVTSIMCSLGDRLGLFKALATSGPVTSAELAGRTGLTERYVREWLSALTAAGYLDYDAPTQRFELPAEHAVVLAGEGGPMFMGGGYQQLPGLFGALDAVTAAFRDGGGVHPDAYSRDLTEGMERTSAGWFDHLLVSHWLDEVPDVRARLEEGAVVADVGSGGGRALIVLAQAFPASRFAGFDVSAAAVARAQANAAAAGVADRVHFEQRDVRAGLPARFDLVTAFDVIHDIAEPVEVLAGIRRAIEPDGSLLMLEINCSEGLEENVGPVAAILYGTSVLFCTPTSLATGGDGLGTLGLPEPKARELCERAGFTRFRRLPVDNLFNVLFEAKA
jgi:2-polyprenyl-3-methyl-5-hydroxy-6-metoxy-1,4-benzoquinol methylase